MIDYQSYAGAKAEQKIAHRSDGSGIAIVAAAIVILVLLIALGVTIGVTATFKIDRVLYPDEEHVEYVAAPDAE